MRAIKSHIALGGECRGEWWFRGAGCVERAVIVQPTAYGFDNRATEDALATRIESSLMREADLSR